MDSFTSGQRTRFGGRFTTTDVTLDTPAYRVGSRTLQVHRGGTLSISANGSASRSGVVWARLSTSQDDDHGLAAGILRAYNAETLQEIWNSEQLPTRDRLGRLLKLIPPVVANGKVFAATYDNALAVYGVLPSFFISASPTSETVRRTGTATYTLTVGANNGTVRLSDAGIPKGAIAIFTPTSISGSGTPTLEGFDYKRKLRRLVYVDDKGCFRQCV